MAAVQQVETVITYVVGQADNASEFPQPVVWVMDIDGTILSMTVIPLLGTGQQGVAYGFEDMHEGNEWMVDGPFANLRKAIDAAILAKSKGQANG